MSNKKDFDIYIINNIFIVFDYIDIILNNRYNKTDLNNKK